MTTDPIAAARAMIEPLTGYTPRPWRVLDESECYSHDDGNTVSVAIGKRDNHAFALAMHNFSDRIVDANAALIAAAPDLRDMVATLADALEEWKDEYQAAARSLRLYKEAASRRQAERDQALARLALAQREMRDRAAQVLDEDYSIGGVNTELDRRICCNGQMCGCMGATVGHYLQHQIRTLEPSPDAKAALNKMLAEARLEGWRAGREAAAKIVDGTARYHMTDPDDIEVVRLTAAEIRALPEPKETSHD